MIDDGFFQGDILNEVQVTQKGQGVKAFLETIKSFKGAFPVLLPLGAGMCLVWKQA